MDTNPFDTNTFDTNHFDTNPTAINDLRGLPARTRRMRRSTAFAGGGLLALLVLMGGCIGGGAGRLVGDPDGTSVGPTAPLVTLVDEGVVEDGEPDVDDDATEDAFDHDDDSTGYPESDEVEDELPPAGEGQGDDGDVELDPVGDPAPDAGPCAAVQDDAQLVVSPDPLVLPSGDMSSTLTIWNCGEGDVDWTAATKPSVALTDDHGTLFAGTSAPLDFTIDADQWAPGAIAFKIKVSEPSANHYVDVLAFRPTWGSDAVADVGLTAGEGSGGCANQCIVSATIGTNYTSPDVSLHVATDTPATIETYLSLNAPNDDPDGNPIFVGPDGDPVRVSPEGSTDWVTNLDGLAPSTEYFIIVRAIDELGHDSFRSGSFTTITPPELPGDLADAGGGDGCAHQCITSALLSAGDDWSSKSLSVASHTPAQFQVSVSVQAPVWNGDVPSFDETDVWVPSGLEYFESWDTTIAGLFGDQTYHIIVQATDVQGRSSYRVGSFHTADAPTTNVLVTLHRIDVSHDGDSSWKNRGELSFAWGVGDDTVGTRGESKISDGESVTFAAWKDSYVIQNASGLMPTIYVSGSERDADGKSEFCTMGTGAFHSAGSNSSCDAKWNVASSGLVQVDAIDSMARCSEFGVGGNWADAACMRLETADGGTDYARFSVIVSFHTPS